MRWHEHPSLALGPLLALSLLAHRRRRTWTPVAASLATLIVLAILVVIADYFHLDAAKNAAHALWPAPFAHMVWIFCGHRGERWIALGYGLASVAIGASYSEAWRAPWLYEHAIVATRWVAALLVTYAWASERTPQRCAPRDVALILGGGHALGVIGAWAAANPWRDWYLARGLTWSEYAVCAMVMACEFRRKR